MEEPGAGGGLRALAGTSSRGEEVEGQGTEGGAAADEPGAGGGLRALARQRCGGETDVDQGTEGFSMLENSKTGMGLESVVSLSRLSPLGPDSGEEARDVQFPPLFPDKVQHLGNVQN